MVNVQVFFQVVVFKQCGEVNPLVLTFLDVGFGGNMVQGFRSYD